MPNLNSDIIADLRGRVEFFSEAFNELGPVDKPIEIDNTDISDIVGTGDRSDTIRDGFVSAMNRYNNARTS